MLDRIGADDSTARIYYNMANGNIGKAAERYRQLLLRQLLYTTIMISVILLAATSIRITLAVTPIWCLTIMYLHSQMLITHYKQLIKLQDNERVRAHTI